VTLLAGGWDTFVGRAAELALLDAARERAASGHTTVVLVAGEPGIGKTALVEHFAERARTAGARVLTGRCWEAGGAPAYWPWVQAIRAHVRQADPDELREHAAGAGTELVQIVPELGELLPTEPPRPEVDAEAARFRVFDAIASFLRRASAGQPIVVLLDDLQSADTPSLLLLSFLARELVDGRVLLVGTYRSVDVAPDRPLAVALVEVVRAPTTRRIELRGLGRTEVAALLADVAGRPPSDDLVELVHERSEGNPLFVGELARMFLATDDPTDLAGEVPAGVRDLIAQRIGRLPDATRELLDVASVFGRDARIDAVASLLRMAATRVLDVADEAIRAGILVDAVSGQELRFSHVLVRDTLYDRLAAARRCQLHQAAGETLEQLYAADIETHLSELAHHFVAAGPAAAPGVAVRYAAEAGVQAARSLAYEEAVRLLRTALELHALEAGDDTTRTDLLLALGDAEARAGEATARATFRQAARLAKAQRRPEVLAQAALGYGGRFVWERAGDDLDLVTQLEDALDALGDADSPLRVRVLARLAGALRVERDPARRIAYGEQAVAIARRLGDPASIAYALDGYHGAIWAPGTTLRRLAIGEEVLATAAAAEDVEEMVLGHLIRFIASCELGDLDAASVALARADPLAARLRQAPQRWITAMCHGSLALWQGRFEEAIRNGEEAQRAVRGALRWDAATATILLRGVVAAELGTPGEWIEAVGRLAAECPWYPHLRALLGLLHLRADDAARARRLLDSLVEDAVSTHDENYGTVTAALLATIADELDATDHAAALCDWMLPYAEQFVVGAPEVVMGSLARHLGAMQGLLGDFEAAEASFATAVERQTAARAWPWLARTHADIARMLDRRGASGDAVRAGEQRERASGIAEELGMQALLQHLGRHPRPHPATSPAGHPDGAPHEGAAFLRQGDLWTITFSGTTTHVRDSLGIRYLARLLANPHRDLPALDLVAGSGESTRRAAHRDLHPADRGAGDPAIDPQARAAYRSRIAELDADVEEATAAGDTERAARARSELDVLLDHLASSVGLGGRSRTTGSPAERARQSVRKAICTALDRIEDHHVELGRHLRATVHTGHLCRYEPDPQAEVRWTT
jgi:tetratricopeptide (TPR) repeat protein